MPRDRYYFTRIFLQILGIFNIFVNDLFYRKKIGEISFAEAQRLSRLAAAVPPGGTIVEVGSLFGSSTMIMAAAMPKDAKIISVDNYCWNPLDLSPEKHRALTADLLSDLVDAGAVELLCVDKEEFYAQNPNMQPDLVFLDANHEYEHTKRDIEWAKSTGAKVISGDDYCDDWPGVIQAVEEAGGYASLDDSVFVLKS